ncbi:MAG TPA: hypothetical protein VGP90_01775, partial [Acidimicrobiia bacterium]|nr:hypothetical protein [Acidimicrobiia bacterium]
MLLLRSDERLLVKDPAKHQAGATGGPGPRPGLLLLDVGDCWKAKEVHMAMTEMETDELERLFKTEVGGLSGRWAAVLTVAWIAIFSLGVVLEPRPADPDAMPFLATVLMTGLMAGWLVMAVGFAQRRRFGALGSLAAAGVLLAMTIACPLSGHHAGIGAWWWFQMAGS